MMNDHNDNPDPLLAAGFAALRAELAGHDAPRCVEKELMQAFARQFPKKQPWYRKLSLPQWGTAGALASMCGVALLLALSPHRAVTIGAPVIGFDDGAAFIALESLERIESEPYTRVVEAELPQSALAPLGMPLNPQTAGETVRAEMLVAQDGHPLAVRLSAVN
ncbi:hypothetical protein SOM61_17655 [Massilia sp. CFBP9012]|uniref:hypothetical protein n=1 Tax=Massilia sp. CFBP9012 TaxID=3096531 RepID=UPI002A6A70BF|nr:hypothetical protein [Massilia sp. CFBP9012]MDY0976794.1 hypothetical protein [Massilia sp. CFBP9012]